MRRENTYPRKKQLLFKIKKLKLKNKKLLKNARHISRTRALSTISRACLKLRKYVFTRKWKMAVTASIYEINSIVGSMLERIPSNNI